MKTGDLETEKSKTDDKPKLKEYDFSSPKKFTKDQLKSLNNLYENFSRVISSYFTSLLRNVCEVSVMQIEEQRYYEFNNALTDNALVGMIDFKPESPQYDETTVMLDISTSFGYLLVERLMGGSEGPSIPDRDYTEIEIAILGHVITNITKYLQEAWANYVGCSIDLRSIETNGRLLQAFSPQDVVVIVSLEMKSSGFIGTANICMPAENLEKLIRSFSMKYSRVAKQHDPERESQKKELMLDYLKQSELEITAILDECEMDLGDILQLQVNDVVSLNRRISDNIVVNVEGIPWYSARLGEDDVKKAVKIVDLIAI